MNIIIPDFYLEEVLGFCCEIKNIEIDDENDDKIVYDYGQMGRFEPFGMLVVASSIRKFMEETASTMEHMDKNFTSKNYAGHMGYFKAVSQDFGKAPGEASGSPNYIPITEIKISKIEADSDRNDEHIGISIEKEAGKLAKVLSRGKFELTQLLKYLIREIIRNIQEHSSADSIWICGQYWSTENIVEIAILDEGMGIRKSLTQNPVYKPLINNDLDSLRLAIEPGVSRSYQSRVRRSNDIWDNSGYGLYMSSGLCSKLGGDFVICSGTAGLLLNEKGIETFKTNFEGTAIRMRLNTREIRKVESIRNLLIEVGEKLAKTNSFQSIKSASKASKMFSILDDEN